MAYSEQAVDDESAELYAVYSCRLFLVYLPAARKIPLQRMVEKGKNA
jgi:hypothetical protein